MTPRFSQKKKKKLWEVLVPVVCVCVCVCGGGGGGGGRDFSLRGVVPYFLEESWMDVVFLFLGSKHTI